MKLVTIKYKCGTIFSIQHDNILDGVWQHGDINEVVYYKDENYIWIDDNKSIYPYSKLKDKDE